MGKMRTLSSKLVLETETVRVLTDAELSGAHGGFTHSNWSMCISNGENNDCHSVLGECETASQRPTPTKTRATK